MHPFIFIVIAAIANAATNILLKVVLGRVPHSENVFSLAITLLKSPALYLGGVFFVVALLSYTMALQRVNLSIAYPLLVSTVALTLITVSTIFLHETLTIPKIIGIAFLVSGVWMIAR